MRKQLIQRIGTVGALAVLALAGWAHGPAGKAIEVSGTVVDVACYVGHESTGPKHAKCAEACAKAGNPLAILETKTGKLYLPVSMDHKNPNTPLMGHIEKRVTVTGKLVEKGGLRGLAIEKVTAAE